MSTMTDDTEWARELELRDRANRPDDRYQVPPNTYTLQFTSLGMCDDLLEDAGYDPDEHADIAKAMALAADLAAVDAAYEVMREHGLKPLADQEPR
jgi:hypothetical protein